MISQFATDYPFALDEYQLQGCTALANGSSVLVAAPTGAGKTVVGEFAVWLAVNNHRKCFYTTPIKALSNQKYHDLVERWGSERVGLLTGDLVINGDAQIVVMTTEVLRNMIYAGSTTLHNLGYVVLDEVHYLADRFRGAVWEEVILGLAPAVSIVALSATVSNVEEFGDWLGEVRGEVEVVVSERRPVPLFQHVMVGRRILDLFAGDSAKVNPELLRTARAEAMTVRDDARRPRGRSGRGKQRPGYGSGAYGGAAHGRFTDKRHTVTRWDMVSALHRANLLPAICFIFSRQGCDHAARQVGDLRLTSNAERELLAAIAQRHTEPLSAADLDALGYEDFHSNLLNGVAPHHAGLLPTFKAIVEEGFEAGALKVVFATETLALGINMPARTVVLERLVKYNGETHADITPGEYTQLTGRAGRRGIDVEGHAVVLWKSGMDPRAVAGLASRRTYPLRSSFAPTYNMAVNLVATQGRERARELLEQSFAQFQADRSVVGQSRVGIQLRQDLAEAQAVVECHLGDFLEYARLRQQISSLEGEGAKQRKADAAREITDAIRDLVVGDVIWVPKQGWSVVLALGVPARRGQAPWIRTFGTDHTTLKLAPQDVRVAPRPIGRVRVPKRFSLKERSDRRALVAALQAKVDEVDPTPPAEEKSRPDAQRLREIAALRRELSSHPCHECPDREAHAVAAARAMRLEKELARNQGEMSARTNSLGASFDKIVGVLTELGYLEDDQVTATGHMLARVYNELDLVACECIRQGVFDDLDVPALAAVLSSLVYESRLPAGRQARMPERSSERAQTRLREVWRDVRAVERRWRIEPGREPDIGFAEASWRWASGQDLGKVLATTELPAGDFVRWVRQVIDLAGQVAQACPPGDLRRRCRELVVAMRRGVIDYDTDIE